jgi:membrane protein
MNGKMFRAVFKETINEFSQDRVMRLAAATAYYAIFSIGPLLVLVIGLAGLVFGEDTVRKEVVSQIGSFVGKRSADLISSMMEARQKGGSSMAAILGAGALVIGATGAFGQLQDSLNTIWGVTTQPGKSVGAFVRDRFLSMAMVLGVGFVLLVSMALSAFVLTFANYIGNLVALPSWLVPAFNGLVDFAVISLLFALIFKVLPDVKIRWRNVWVGAVGTALLFTLGKWLLSFYLAHATSASAYGAGSAFVVVLLYIYYASIILYFGAEFTQVYAHQRGSRFIPSIYAVHITDFERAEQGMPTRRRVEEAIRRHESEVASRDSSAKSTQNDTADAKRQVRGEEVSLLVRPLKFLGLAFIIGAAAGLYATRSASERLSSDD